jgi:hypothetical protein
MDEGKGKKTSPMITISLDDLDKRIQHDLAVHEHAHRAEETTREKVEGYLYMACLVLSAVFIIVHTLTDWIPLLVGVPSARVILTRWL